MAMVDIFIILKEVQFEKNGYQNRYKTSKGWVTKPVNRGLEPISSKRYTDGNEMLELNMFWIRSIKNTLGIKTKIVYDFNTGSKGTKHLVDLIKFYDGSVYVTNPEAKDKYLDEMLMTHSGIDIEYCKVPKHLQIHTFEAFEKWGIEGTIKQLPKRTYEIAQAVL
jgi:hypothetical protein